VAPSTHPLPLQRHGSVGGRHAAPAPMRAHTAPPSQSLSPAQPRNHRAMGGARSPSSRTTRRVTPGARPPSRTTASVTRQVPRRTTESETICTAGVGVAQGAGTAGGGRSSRSQRARRRTRSSSPTRSALAQAGRYPQGRSAPHHHRRRAARGDGVRDEVHPPQRHVDLATIGRRARRGDLRDGPHAVARVGGGRGGALGGGAGALAGPEEREGDEQERAVHGAGASITRRALTHRAAGCYPAAR
jgi:hypothetical protein